MEKENFLEPQFLVNEFMIRDKEDLKEVARTLSGKAKKFEARATFLHDYMNALYKAHLNSRDRDKINAARLVEYNKKQAEKKKKHSQKLKADLEWKRQQILAKMGKLGHAIPGAAPEVPEAPSPVAPLPADVVKGKKDLVFSKLTKKALVSSEFDGASYKVVEPALSEPEKNLLAALKKEVTKDTLAKDDFKKKLADAAQKMKLVPSDDLFDKIRYYLVRDKVRFGKVSPMLEDIDVSEIVCDGVGKPLRVTYHGKEVPTAITFASREELNAFILYLAKMAGTSVSVDNPFLSVSIEGFSVQGTLGAEFVSPKFVIVKQGV